MTRIIRKTVTISGPGLLAKYNALKARGYTTLWVGEGRMCLEAPEVELTEEEVSARTPTPIIEVRAKEASGAEDPKA